MKENSRIFLDEGLTVYGQARDTLLFFEQEIANSIKEILDHRISWKPLKNVKIKSVSADRGQGQMGYWISADIVGELKRFGKIQIDCGIWWKALKNDHAPIIYASFYESREEIMKFDWKQNRDGIRSFERFKKTFLYFPESSANEIEKMLNKLLDALLKRLE